MLSSFHTNLTFHFFPQENKDVDEAIKTDISSFGWHMGCWKGGPSVHYCRGEVHQDCSCLHGLSVGLVLLIGIFYVFNVEYPAKAKGVFIFLKALLLENDTEAKKRVTVQKTMKE